MKKTVVKGTGLYFFFLAIFFIATGCDKIDQGEANYVKTATKYNVTNTLSFTIDSLRDYRCPKDMMCFWSGDVELYFRINHNFSRTDTVIYLLTRNNNPFVLGGFTWHVEDVTPWLASGESIDQSRYRIRLVVTRKQD